MKRAGQPLVLKNLTKKYGKYRGVDDISLELKPGEVFGFLGPNGAGKSTTIRTILNFIKPSQGTVSVFGLDSVNDDVQIKNHIGYLAGDIALYDNMTGKQVLEYLTSLGKQTDWAFVDELTSNFKAELNRRIKTLSKGNIQKIGLMQAFMHKPELIILDEPTSGLDPLMKQAFYNLIDEMKRQNKTVFVSSHDLTEVQRICDRAAFIRDGKMIAIEDIKNSKTINLHRYTVTFKAKPNIADYKKLSGIKDISVDKNQLTITLTGAVTEFIKEIAMYNAVDLFEEETNLEDLFMHFYGKGAQNE